MRIRRVHVTTWRNLRDISIDVPADASMVCLVGENGSGKSAVLELLSAVSNRLGISPGVELPRGDPFSEPHEFEVLASAPEDVRPAVDEVLSQAGRDDLEWNGDLLLSSTPAMGLQITAPSIDEPDLSRTVAQRVIQELQNRQQTQHLFLDADRAYPLVQIQPHQFGDIWSQDWESPALSKQWAYRPTKTLYEEWNKYFLGTEERAATQHVAAIRRARQFPGSPEPSFVDPFDGYRASLAEVLPHLQFVGVQSEGTQRSIFFDSAGLELPFHKLSGGEREIAFLVGQIERFKLRQGLLMIDEPELHLNPDLLRTWVAFLRDTVEDGQVWLATHSLEAVEVAGPEASFVFEKNVEERITRSVAPLVGRPVVSALSAAVGAPAFSISRLRFVYVEGDRHSRERERFYDVAGEPSKNRFMEGGSCHEVLRRFDGVRDLAAETGEQLRIGAVIDRDFRSDVEAASLESSSGVHVLRCHEIENSFLDPAGLDVLLARGTSQENATDLIRSASDAFAGLWVGQRADASLPDLKGTPKASLTALSSLSWEVLLADQATHVSSSADAFADSMESTAWALALEAAIQEYAQVRAQPDLWLHCLGKQTLGRVATSLGFSSSSVLQRHVLAMWGDQLTQLPVPIPVDGLRAYLRSLDT